MSYNYNLLNRLHEARVERTIDPKLWASVSSACSKMYKNDLGKSAKPMGTRELLLQRFVAGLIILKLQCPITEKDMENCPAFPQWASKLLEMGITILDVHKLWNENCGKLPKVDTTMNILNSANIPDDDDDIITGVTIDDDDEDDIQMADNDAVLNQAQPEIEYSDIPEDDVIEETPKQQPTLKSNISPITAPYDSDPYTLINSVHKLLFGKGSQFTNLHGCSDPVESMKFLPKLNPNSEGINRCDNLTELLSMNANIYALRVFKGGDPEEVKGDCVWCDATTNTSYYVGVSPTNVSIYYKDNNGDFTLAWQGNHADFGFV